MRNGVSNGTNTSYFHPLSVLKLSRDTKTVLPPYRGSAPCIIAEKALKMPHLSKTGSKNMAETCAIDFSYPTSYLTSIQRGGLSALLLPVLMVADHGLRISRKTNKVPDRRLAVAAVGPVMDTTALGLHSNNLLWNIERRNLATFRTLLAASREKHLVTMQRYTLITVLSGGR